MNTSISKPASIPTASEFFNKFSLDGLDELFNENPQLSPRMRIKTAMIEFAKLHRQAQAEAIKKKSFCRVISSNSEGIEAYIDENSIDDAYPLTNIR